MTSHVLGIAMIAFALGMCVGLICGVLDARENRRRRRRR